MPRPAALLLLVPLAAALGPAWPGTAPALAESGRAPRLQEQPGERQPLLFRDARGGAFRPRRLIVAGPAGAIAARLPGTARARSEDRLDLSGAPVLGPLFRGTLDTDTARGGPAVGRLYRAGDTLVVEVTEPAAGLARLPVALTTNIPRYGAISYALGALAWRPVQTPPTGGSPLGSAHLLGGALVLASQGGEPAWPSVEALIRDLF